MTRRSTVMCAAALLAVSGAAAMSSGCKPKSKDLPICPEMVAAGKADEADSRNLPIDVWFSVLVKNFNRTAMDPGDEPRECSNQPIAVSWPVAMTGDPRASARKLTREARTEADITFAESPEGEMLVWARTDALENGDAIGPIGLIRWVERGIEVRGIGTVQAPAKRVRMRLEPVGDDLRVLVLESETCPEPKPGEAAAEVRCVREAQIVPLANQRFVSSPLMVDGQDTGPARFLLADERDEPLKDGWVRRYELQRRLEFDGVSVIVQENIRTRDCNPKEPATPCEEHIAANEKRTLAFKDGALYTTPSAWANVAKPAAVIP